MSCYEHNGYDVCLGINFEKRMDAIYSLIKEHIDKGISLGEIQKKYKIDHAKLTYLIALYRKHGPSPFQDNIRCYSRELKLASIRRVLEGDESIRHVALDIGLPEDSTLGDWVKMYKEHGVDSIRDSWSRAHYLKHEDRLNKIAEDSLIDRIKYLEAENEYLKKLYSLTQKGNQKEK